MHIQILRQGKKSHSLFNDPCTMFRNSNIYFVFQSDAGWEEYYDYIFPDETAAQPNLKLLAMAKKWKEQQANTQEEEDSDSDNMDEQ